MPQLNESVKRDRHFLPSVEQSLAQLGDAKVFSKLDANSGFWQIKLDPEPRVSHLSEDFVLIVSCSESLQLQSTFRRECHVFSKA